MKTTIALSFIALLLTGASCEKSENEPTPIRDKVEFTTKSLQVIEEGEAFGWNIFRKLNEMAEPGENVVISPLSINQAFGMAINGATGENLVEMLDVLGYQTSTELNGAFKNLREALETADPKVELGIANSAWYRNNYSIKDDFFQSLKDYYNAEVTGLDFNNVSNSLNVINNWVKNKTKGKIPTIVEDISPDHILFLINAVYFNGEWASRFDKKQTANAPFYLSNGETVSVKMMHQKEDFEIFHQENFSGIKLPYGNEAYYMAILLPNEGVTANDVVSGLNKQTAEIFRNNYGKMEVKVFLPRFKTECEFGLIPALQALGMERAFSDATGFHNIAIDDIIISDVIHKTFIEVDERGTEAAAATSIGFITTSMPPATPEFRVDRPFVFTINEKSSGAVLFAGKIENPLK
ncbi:serpin family protein [Alkalitalea saponilacus]|uniref:Serpin B n=1 Tax=Alkalitalea saponilacus TaxID=889453 RepID=A0A1T5GMA2_9BACT|nr:serpin family protein [Alkalitalea saponilacus]ASB48275.1 serpin [Alkalitalea saponilacus]SKC09517.1 serpin B [Alkalitalea saponilacus]